MHITTVIMKDGREFSGVIWMWRPQEGWFSMPSDESAPDKILLKDVKEASKEDRVDTSGEEQNIDLLKRARAEGWTG